ncbi:hypothetical protein PV326_003047 [Microctonus aethiopoides]|nr:hypothetical protein PV326_003047 [Microctonus aethiopoides]
MTDSQQQFCLRWNNFQANITSQFEALRDDEDFVDVTFACDGRRLQAHKVVLSACSPYFKELFKTNPCKHPIIFMRDVEFEHLQSLLEFMYAGEVNISQAELPTFLRTAESLQIRGLTDSQNNQHNNEKHSKINNVHASNGRDLVSPSFDDERSRSPPASSPPPLKRLCKKSDSPKNSSPVPAATPCPTTPRTRPLIEPQVQLDCYKDLDIVEPKVELPEYGSDEDYSPKQEVNAIPGGFLSLDGGMEVLPTYPPAYQGSGMEGGMPGPSHGNAEPNQEQGDFHDVNPSDRQLQEEIYQHQLKVQVGGQVTTPSLLQQQQQGHVQVQNGVENSLSSSQCAQQNQTQIDSNQSVPPPSLSQLQQHQHQQQIGSPEDVASDDGGGEGKLRAYHAHVGDTAYPVEVVQITESKNFTGGMLQYNASY